MDTLFEKLVRTIKLPLRTTYFDTKKLPFCTTSFNRIECTGCHEITPFEISQYRIEPAIIQAPISKFNTLAECIRDVFRSEVIVIMFNFLSFFFLTTVNHFSQNVELNCDSCKTPFATQKLEIRSFPVLLCIMINRHATAIVDDVSKTAVPMGDAGVFVADDSVIHHESKLGVPGSIAVPSGVFVENFVRPRLLDSPDVVGCYNFLGQGGIVVPTRMVGDLSRDERKNAINIPKGTFLPEAKCSKSAGVNQVYYSYKDEKRIQFDEIFELCSTVPAGHYDEIRVRN